MRVCVNVSLRMFAAIATSIAVAGCASGSGSGPGAVSVVPTSQPPAAGRANSQHVQVQLEVPQEAGSASPAATARKRSYISKASKSVVFTIEQPQEDQPELQSAQLEYDLVPGPNDLDLPVEAGPLTLQASIYDQAGGKGHELSRSDSMNLTATDDSDTPVDMLFNPIIVAGSAGVVGPVSTFTVYYAQNAGGDYVTCIGVSGQLLITGVDGAGQAVYGPGRFLDTAHDDVTLTVTGGLVTVGQTITFKASGLVAASGGPLTQAGGGAFAQVGPIDLTPATAGELPGVEVTASSSLVTPGITVGAPAEIGGGPLCSYVTGG